MPIENALLFAIALAFYIAIANYVVFHTHYMINDAYARIDNAFDVLFTRDPHLAAIGFVWPPLPSFLELPIIAFKNQWPALVTQGFAGSIMAAMFGAGTVVLFNIGLRWAGVVRGMRWVFCLVWLINPMIVIYSVQGMSEMPFVFFGVASVLLFLRWSETRRPALLPLLGLVAGLGCLCRNEMFALTFFIGVGVVLKSIRWRVSWREVETRALMFALPALLMMGLWIGSMAVIEHDPLYWLHYNQITTSAAPAAAAASSSAVSSVLSHAVLTSSPVNLGGGITISSWQGAFNYIIGHSLALFPAVIGAVGLLGARILVKRDRLTGLILLSFAVPVAAIDVFLLHSGALAPTLRYQIWVIPFAFIVCVYVLRSLRSKRPAVLSSLVALGMVSILGFSNVATAMTLGDSGISQEEWPLVAAITNGKTIEQVTGGGAIQEGMRDAPKVEALDTDHGLIACDSTTCFPIVLNAKNPHMFVVTSDRDFQAVVAQPQVYHVEYFLMQNSDRDQINVTYPGLYDDGAGFASFVGDVGDGFRMYRITGPTGRG